MPPKKIALISDAWDPQVNGVVTTFKNIIPLLNKKGFDVEVLHPEMFRNFSYPWYKEIKFSYNDGYESYNTKKTFEGVINNLERRYLETDSEWKREEISQYQSESSCEKCNGQRLKDEALCIKINSLNISQVTKKSIEDASLALKEALKKDDIEDIKKKTETLVQSSMKLGEAIYKSQQSTKPDSKKDDGDDDKGKKDDNVVDADFEEVKDENKEKSA